MLPKTKFFILTNERPELSDLSQSEGGKKTHEGQGASMAHHLGCGDRMGINQGIHSPLNHYSGTHPPMTPCDMFQISYNVTPDTQCVEWNWESIYCINSIFMIQGLCIILMLWLIIIWGGLFIHRYFMSEILILWAASLWTLLHRGFPSLSSVIAQSIIVPCLDTQSHLLDSIFISPSLSLTRPRVSLSLSLLPAPLSLCLL